MNPQDNLAAAPSLSRRSTLAIPALGGLMLLCPGAEAQPEPSSKPKSDWPDFPEQPANLVRAFVGAAHGNLPKVEAMLKATPGLIQSAWDWGFGDWETALGAASHTGNRAIATLLLDHGARLDIFAATMLGMLGVVEQMVAARPGIQRTLGPHHITLLKHAKAGGSDAARVAEFLTSLGGADDVPASIALDEARAAIYAGSYASTDATPIRFRIFLDKGKLSFQHNEDQPRQLTRVSEHEFFPSGVPSVRLRFNVEGDHATQVSILAPEPALSARRES